MDGLSDGKVYTFKIRRECEVERWPPLTARDFVESWKRTLSPETAASYNYQLFYVKNAQAFAEGKITDFSEVGVKALDDHTLEVTLENPTPFFLDLCATPPLQPVPVDRIKQFGDDWVKPGRIVGNGAYVLEDWRINDRIRLRKNPNYWNAKKVALESVETLPISVATVAFNFYAGGLADLIVDKNLTPNALLDELKKTPAFHSAPFLGIYFLRFNCSKPPFNDPRVRRAFAMAVDKRRIVEKITRAGELPAASFVPPGIAGYASPDGLPYDPTRRAGFWPRPDIRTARAFPSPPSSTTKASKTATSRSSFKPMWLQHLGVKVNLALQEWKVYLNSLSSLDYGIARSSWVGRLPRSQYVSRHVRHGQWQQSHRLERSGLRPADRGRREGKRSRKTLRDSPPGRSHPHLPTELRSVRFSTTWESSSTIPPNSAVSSPTFSTSILSRRCIARIVRTSRPLGRLCCLGSRLAGAEAAAELSDPFDRDLDLIERGGIAASHVAFAACAKGGAGNHGDLLFSQQPQGKFATRQTGGADFRKHVERAAGFKTFQAEFVETSHDIVAAQLIFSAHREHAVLAALKRLDGGLLAHDRRAEHRVLVNLHHRLDHRLRRAGITDAPARHRVGLGHAVQEDRALFHARQGGQGGMRRGVVGQLAVDFVRQHDEVVLDADCGDLLELLAGIVAPVGLVGKFSMSTLDRGVTARSRASARSTKWSAAFVGMGRATPRARATLGL